MSVKIGELSDSLISFFPVFILSNNKNWATEVSDTNKLFAILNNYKTLSYCFDENCFTVKKQQLDQLISQLKADEIPFEIQAEKPSPNSDDIVLYSHFGYQQDIFKFKKNSRAYNVLFRLHGHKSSSFEVEHEKGKIWWFLHESNTKRTLLALANENIPYQLEEVQEKHKHYSEGNWKTKAAKKEIIVSLTKRTDGLIAVKFPYSELVCTLVKEIEGRVFKPEYKEWHIDQQGVEVFVSKLQKNSIAYEFTH